MKIRTLILAGAAATAVFFPQARAGQEQQKPDSSVTAPASQETISLEVTGMT